MKILNGILAVGLILILSSCGSSDSGSDQKDSNPRKGSGEIKNYNGGEQDLFAPTLIDDSLNSLAIDKVGTIDSNGKFEFALPKNLNPQETVTEFFVLNECNNLEISNGNAKVSTVGYFEVGLDTGILMQASSQEAVSRIFELILGGSLEKDDSSIIRYYVDADVSIKGNVKKLVLITEQTMTSSLRKVGISLCLQ